MCLLMRSEARDEPEESPPSKELVACIDCKNTHFHGNYWWYQTCEAFLTNKKFNPVSGIWEGPSDPHDRGEEFHGQVRLYQIDVNFDGRCPAFRRRNWLGRWFWRKSYKIDLPSFPGSTTPPFPRTELTVDTRAEWVGMDKKGRKRAWNHKNL